MRSLLLAAAFGLWTQSACAAEMWSAGAAQVAITPEEPMWMSGYASRTNVAEGKEHDLYCKAVVIQDPKGERIVLVTLDLVGIDRETSVDVCRQLKERFGLERRQVAINTSHTHCGPVVGTNLRPMYTTLSDDQWKQVVEYTARLKERIVDCVGQAIQNVGPAKASWGQGRATFAVNRRENREADVPMLREQGTPLKGPIDHDVPVLALHDEGGKLKAVVFGYACHATTLSYYKWCGDYPGFAYREIERRHPGAVALFWAGCGADQNPIPRRTLELAQKYGQQLAESVETVLSGTMRPLGGSLRAEYAEIDLELAHIPTKEELETTVQSKERYEAARARLLLDKLARDGKLNPTYPYPVQVWRLGDGPTWAHLGGEVVVDYALRLKEELGSETTWVAGYTNDVMAYIPSRRVLAEGRYEGATSMVYYGLPGPWHPMLEDAIVKAVHAAARR